MYCLSNMCYVCLEEKNKSISNINSSLSVNKDIIDIIGYVSFNLSWLKTKQIILICEECCLRLRETYQFLAMCLKNSALLQSYTNSLNTITPSNTENEAVLTVTLDLNNEYKNINEIKLEDGKRYTDECGSIIEETDDVYVNLADCVVKEEDTWNREEHPMDNNFSDNKSDSEIFVNTPGNETEVTVTLDLNNKHINMNEEVKCEIIVKDEQMFADEWKPVIEETENKPVNFEYIVKEEEQEEADDKEEEHLMDNNSTASNSNAYITDTDSVSSELPYNKQVDVTNNKEPKKRPHACSTCSKSFTKRFDLKRHILVHTREKPYKCSSCDKCFSVKAYLVRHARRVHTGRNSVECSECGKCLASSATNLPAHPGERAYDCSRCGNYFSQKLYLMAHKRMHTGEKPYKCSICEKCFTQNSSLMSHMRLHTGEKRYTCPRCDKCFSRNSTLADHMRVHTGEKPFKCSRCEKCFTLKSSVVRHMRVHIGENAVNVSNQNHQI